MKTFLKSLSMIALTMAFAQAAGAEDTIAITEFMNESKGSETESEWIELYNYGSAAVSLDGWTLVDDDTDVGVIPDLVIEPEGYAVLARNKQIFEVDWLAGVSNSKVVQFTGTFAQSATRDEIVLKDSGGSEVWRVAYGDDDTVGRATFLTGVDFSRTAWGTKTSPGIDRNGIDSGGTLGYERNDATADGHQYSAGNRDWGSPLRGHYGSGTSPAFSHIIDVRVSGVPINPGIRGVALSDITVERPSYYHGIPDSVNVSDGGSIRGVAGGLYADLYDWRTRVSSYHSWYTDETQARPPTLEFLRWARDHSATLLITANTRGLVEYDPVNIGKVRYYTTDVSTLADLASDWVRYVNHIVPTYRQGDTITDARDLAIYSSLVWSSTFANDGFDTLLAPDEAAVPKNIYWEIGNEPRVSVGNSIGVSNGSALDATEYYTRYKAVSIAMKAEDTSIKVGPCLVNGSGSGADYVTKIAEDAEAPIDFISYHPYQKLGDETTIEGMEEYLGTVYSNQLGRWKDIRDALETGGRNPDRIEMVASEVNVSNWPYNETLKEGEMAHALGSVETIFVFARLGLTAAHYWIWPADQDYSTPYPVYKAFEKMRDYMGDRLIDFYSIDNRARVYTTFDSKSQRLAIWGLNFQNSQSATVNLSLAGIHGLPEITRLTLKNPTAITTLTSGNYSAYRAGGPRQEVDWVETDMVGLDPSDFELALEPATISVMLIEPVTTANCGSNMWLYD